LGGGRNEDRSGALEALFDPRPGDDVVAIAEAEGCFQRAFLVPEVVELSAEVLELRGRGWVVPLRQHMPQLGPLLAQLLDLLVDLGQVHVTENAGPPDLIPEAR
jgi:hypothetical protein